LTLEQEVQEKTTQDDIQTSDLNVLNIVRELHEESTLISQLSDMERTHSTEVMVSLRRLLEANGKSFHLSPEMLARVEKNVTDVVLTPQGSICLIHNNGQFVTRSLENLSSESLMRVLGQILPEVKISLAERRRKLSVRAGLFEQMAGDLKDISDAAFPKSRTRVPEAKPQPKEEPQVAG